MRTMRTAGRAVVFSGLTVAAGLALLLAIHLPFIRSMGSGGPPHPTRVDRRRAHSSVGTSFDRRTASIHAVALRSLSRGGDRFWRELACVILRRPVIFLLAGTAVLLALAAQASSCGSRPPRPRYSPSLESIRGFDLLAERVAAGAATPTEIVVDSRPMRASRQPKRSARTASATPSSASPRRTSWRAARNPLRRRKARYARGMESLTGRLHFYERFRHATSSSGCASRSCPVSLSGGDSLYVGGIPAQGSDYLTRAYDSFPGSSPRCCLYVILVRARSRSILIPLKAVVPQPSHRRAGPRDARRQLSGRARDRGTRSLPSRRDRGGWVPIFLFATPFRASRWTTRSTSSCGCAKHGTG